MQPLQKQLVVLLWLRVTGKDKESAISCWQVNIDHLYRRHFFDHRPAGQPMRRSSEPLL